ncbi:hypothetical protein EHW64_13730 [Erwinia psidii]|uniref:hypothetical protein n=1 Tax=Erwinia psidii TaxID=69224 RepID=UPI00226B35EC|nr:hypothetical protein [Erwinia psidii]MCX8962163.1 hypothetical protein [Erwinia psidii]
MQAAEFNKRYPVGTTFIHQPCRALRGGRVVKTVDKANDLKCGTIVEINLEPYFVKTETLTNAG